METKIEKIDKNKINEEIIEEAGMILKNGGLVAFPTETVYGLGADALKEEAAMKTYAAKGRPSDNPLIVHIAEYEDLRKIAVNIPAETDALAAHFWPGPLTMIFEKSEVVPYGTTGGLDTVAVRMPTDEVARALIRAAGGFVSAPSANTSGRPSPTLAEHVAEDLGGKIDMILDGGAVEIGLESTILDMTVTPPMILRPGAITAEMFEEVIGKVDVDETLLVAESEKAPKAPGMKYRHYAPKAKLMIVEGDLREEIFAIRQLAYKAYKEGRKVISSLEDELLKCDKFDISVAFITDGGIEPLLQTLKILEMRGIEGRILTTDYLEFSDPKALRKLASFKNIELKMFMSEEAGEGFHTKGYMFKNNDIYKIIIGYT